MSITMSKEVTIGSMVGKKAPAFKLPASDGKVYSLKDFAGKKLVIYFYPKDLTPGCTQESCDFRDSFTRLKSLKTQIVGVSKDSLASHEKFIATHKLPFLLLSDEDKKMCNAYGVWIEKSLYGRKYMGSDRATFVIDEKGKVLAQFNKVKVKGHVDQVIEALLGEKPKVASTKGLKDSLAKSATKSGAKSKPKSKPSSKSAKK